MTGFDFFNGPRAAGFASGAMIATSHPLATSAGLRILSRGGNAYDAAIAASAVQAVVDPLMTGIGGDCFALVAGADGLVRALNGSGQAPAAATVEALREAGVEPVAVLAIFSYGFERAAERFAAAGVRLATLTNFATLLRVAERIGALDFDDIESLRRWQRDPEGWSQAVG